jgi:type IV secretory pathway VirB6-like protein
MPAFFLMKFVIALPKLSCGVIDDVTSSFSIMFCVLVSRLLSCCGYQATTMTAELYPLIESAKQSTGPLIWRNFEYMDLPIRSVSVPANEREQLDANIGSRIGIIEHYLSFALLMLYLNAPLKYAQGSTASNNPHASHNSITASLASASASVEHPLVESH